MAQRTPTQWAFFALALLALAGCLGVSGLFANSQETKQPPPPPSQSETQRGEQVFMAQCSRCHKPPMTIPPRITGTVVMHMRVRAKLSRQDQQALLRYLAP